jgi:hypothetical protein
VAVINKERFVELCTDPSADPHLRRQFVADISYALGVPQHWTPQGMRPVQELEMGTEEAALRILEQIRENTVRRGYLGSKGLRPWVYNIGSMRALDQGQTWWGFEFETGYDTEEDRSRAVAYAWDNYDNVVFDAEGEGYESEITFAPAARSSFEDGTAPAYQFMQYLGQMSGTYYTGETDVGTHWNFSHPCFRGSDDAARNNVEFVARVLNSTLGKASGPELWQEFFGRSYLYGGFFVRSGYIEGKLFRTTYDFSQFQRYLKVVKAMDKIACMAVELRPNFSVTNADWTTMTCLNFEAVVKDGAEPEFGNWTGPRDAYAVNYNTQEQDSDYYDDDDEGCGCEECVAARDY